METNIKVLKLLSGEEVVADITDEGSFFKLKNPVKFVMMPVNQSQVGVEMHPFIMLSKDSEIELSKDFVIAVCTPIDEIVKSYSAQFSDIILPPEKKLIT